MRVFLGAVLGVWLGAGPVMAQDVDCDRLAAAINAPGGGGSGLDGGDNSYVAAARRQNAEIDRTRDYADSIGCNGRHLGLFGDDEPAECHALDARLERMQGNLGQIEARGRQLASQTDGRRGDLIARYNAACATNPAILPQGQGRGFVDDDGRSGSGLRTVPIDPDDLSGLPLGDDDPDADRTRTAGKALCVRTCDGGYFPLSAKASDSAVDGLEQLCKASCPNTEAKLYTTASGGGLQDATAVDGTPYTALATAFKFEKSFDASCTCKPYGQSWAQALATAETLLGEAHKGDVVVTDQISDKLAVSRAPVPARVKPSKRSQASAALEADRLLLENQRAAQAPTASNASAGIAASPAQGAATVKAGEGPTRTVKGPDGSSRTIRIIVP